MPKGRPPLPEGEKRVYLGAWIDPETHKDINERKSMTGKSKGKVLDEVFKKARNSGKTTVLIKRGSDAFKEREKQKSDL